MKIILYICAFLALAGCERMKADWDATKGFFSGKPYGSYDSEYDQGEGEKVQRITGEDKTYPNLGDVPQRPNDVPSLAERHRIMDEMVRGHEQEVQQLDDVND